MVTTLRRRTAAGSAFSLEPTRRPSRAAWVVVVLAAVLAGVAVAVWLARDPGTVSGSTPAPSETSSVETSEVRWEEVGGVLLPFSATHGPRINSNGMAASYSRSEAGAALAAVQILMRTSATAGSTVFLPVLTSQVTGANVPALKAATLDTYDQLRRQARVEDGAPIPGSDARIAGYLIAGYSPDAATVDVLIGSPRLATGTTLIGFAVTVQWTSGDWRALAPPGGDWAAVATPYAAAPAGMLTYDQIGPS